MFFEKSKNQKVDVFYLYPTCGSPEGTGKLSEINEHMKHEAMKNYLLSVSAFDEYTNIYAPYYRQAPPFALVKAGGPDGILEYCRDHEVRTDVYAALDFFFENCNAEKPFILAGHSQGSCLLKIVLSEYMREHPEYLDRMISCYAIGYYFPQEWFDANPHIKKASGETDTGVLITWNTEAPGGEKFNIPLGNHDGFNINPLSWATDEQHIGVDKNKGSVLVDSETLEKTYVDGLADAAIDRGRGTVICSTYENVIPDNPLFGDKSFHFDDWALYYENIKENGQKRINAFLEK